MWKTIVTIMSQSGRHWRHGAPALHPLALGRGRGLPPVDTFRYVSMRFVLTRLLSFRYDACRLTPILFSAQVV